MNVEKKLKKLREEIRVHTNLFQMFGSIQVKAMQVIEVKECMDALEARYQLLSAKIEKYAAMVTPAPAPQPGVEVQ